MLRLFQIDGHNCSPTPIGRVLANLNYASHVNNEHRSTESKISQHSSYYFCIQMFANLL